MNQILIEIGQILEGWEERVKRIINILDKLYETQQ